MNPPGSFQLPGMIQPHSFGGSPGKGPAGMLKPKPWCARNEALRSCSDHGLCRLRAAHAACRSMLEPLTVSVTAMLPRVAREFAKRRSADWKQAAYPTAKGCSGFVPGPRAAHLLR